MNLTASPSIGTRGNGEPLAELHSHIGAAARPASLWRIAHEQGIKLPTKDYWEFVELITVTKHGGGVTALDRDKYHWTELIQSSPLAIGQVVNRTIGGAYRAANIVMHEIRYNPMKRNRGGERDLDHIILSTLNGMDLAQLEYPQVRVGLILELDRTFTRQMNEVIYEKAQKYKARGIVGIDIAGPQHPNFMMKDYIDLFTDAKTKGFGVTIHTGEEGGLDEMRLVVTDIQPHRIGHGLMAHQDPSLMQEMKQRGTVLELCPTSNLNTGIVRDTEELHRIYRTLFDAGVTLTINTDGPEMHRTNLRNEFDVLVDTGVFTLNEKATLIQNAFSASFINGRRP